MLIDTSHRRWIAVTAIVAVASGGLYWWLNQESPQPLTGGTTAGLWYGVAGALLMIYAGLLSAHRRLARWRFLPRRSWMLKGHIWLGLLSFWMILLHSGFYWGGTLTTVLWIVLGLIVVSGILGLVLQNTLPRLMAERVAEETPYEQMPHVCRQLMRRAAEVADAICGPSTGTATARGQLRGYYDAEIAPFLAGTALSTTALHDSARTRERFAQFVSLPELAPDRPQLLELEQLCEQRRQIAVQERLHHWLHGWLLVHIPLSLALLVLGLAHVIMALYY
ncbi:MAG TPA: hypothetical protein VE988_00360 [Gemmataceae bacterium]|nr:hypothetical protein [Gemmataceae bacterium]